MNLGTIYQKLRDGDKLTNEELNFAIKEFEDLENKLLQLGPVFQLSRVEITQRLHEMRTWKFHREND